MVLKLSRSRSMKSLGTALKLSPSVVADKTVADETVELRDEQNIDVVVEDSKREGTEDSAPYSLGNLFNCWGVDTAANDGDVKETSQAVAAAETKDKEKSTAQSAPSTEVKSTEVKKVSRKQLLIEKVQARKEKVQAKKAAHVEAKKAAAARKQAKKEEKEAIEAAKKAAKEESKNVTLLHTDPPVKKSKTQDEGSIGTLLKQDENSVEKLLQQLEAEQKELVQVDKRKARVEEKILVTIRKIKAAAINSEDLDSVLYANDDLRDILSLDGDGAMSFSETSSFRQAEDEREILSVIADGCFCA